MEISADAAAGGLYFFAMVAYLARRGGFLTGGFFLGGASEGVEAMRTASAARRRAAWSF